MLIAPTIYISTSYKNKKDVQKESVARFVQHEGSIKFDEMNNTIKEFLTEYTNAYGYLILKILIQVG